jgi:glycerol-3-phosphate dehydrogenase (NAD(P)+)
MQTKKQKIICVIGAGQFGTCLAQHLATLGNKVFLWARSSDVSAGIQQLRKNIRYLSNYSLHPNVIGTSLDLRELLPKVDTVVLAIPTQSLRQVLQDISCVLDSSVLLVCASKGLEISSNKFPLEIISDVLGREIGNKSVYFSGPSFAHEIMERLPTAISVAGDSRDSLLAVQQIFHSSHLRIYTSADVIGLEVAGALKNVIAIAAGVCSGLGYGLNSRAALITRGLAEVMKVGVSLGARTETFLGLGGVGDIFLTCSSENSRNFRVGSKLAQGIALDKILQDLGSTAEGVATARSAHNLCVKLKVRHPIIETVYQVLYDNVPVKKAVFDLIESSPREEFE